MAWRPSIETTENTPRGSVSTPTRFTCSPFASRGPGRSTEACGLPRNVSQPVRSLPLNRRVHAVVAGRCGASAARGARTAAERSRPAADTWHVPLATCHVPRATCDVHVRRRSRLVGHLRARCDRRTGPRSGDRPARPCRSPPSPGSRAARAGSAAAASGRTRGSCPCADACRARPGCTSIFRVSAPVFFLNSSRYSASGTMSIWRLASASLSWAMNSVASLPCTTSGAPTPLPTEHASCIVQAG